MSIKSILTIRKHMFTLLGKKIRKWWDKLDENFGTN